MRKKKNIEEELNEFLKKWDVDKMIAFLADVIPLIELYDVDEKNNWLRDLVGKENELNVRVIRTIYLISRLAEFHGADLCGVKINFKDLWKRLENCLKEE
jgi:hypothetical protein